MHHHAQRNALPRSQSVTIHNPYSSICPIQVGLEASMAEAIVRLQLPKPKLAQTLLPSHLAPATPSLAGDTTAMLVDARPQLWTASNTAPARAGHKDRYTVGRQRRHVRRVKAAPSHAAHMAALAGPSVSGLAEQPASQPATSQPVSRPASRPLPHWTTSTHRQRFGRRPIVAPFTGAPSQGRSSSAELGTSLLHTRSTQELLLLTRQDSSGSMLVSPIRATSRGARALPQANDRASGLALAPRAKTSPGRREPARDGSIWRPSTTGKSVGPKDVQGVYEGSWRGREARSPMPPPIPAPGCLPNASPTMTLDSGRTVVLTTNSTTADATYLPSPRSPRRHPVQRVDGGGDPRGDVAHDPAHGDDGAGGSPVGSPPQPSPRTPFAYTRRFAPKLLPMGHSLTSPARSGTGALEQQQHLARLLGGGESHYLSAMAAAARSSASPVGEERGGGGGGRPRRRRRRKLQQLRDWERRKHTGETMGVAGPRRSYGRSSQKRVGGIVAPGARKRATVPGYATALLGSDAHVRVCVLMLQLHPQPLIVGVMPRPRTTHNERESNKRRSSFARAMEAATTNTRSSPSQGSPYLNRYLPTPAPVSIYSRPPTTGGQLQIDQPEQPQDRCATVLCHC